MQSQRETDVVEVNRQLLGQLEEMEFPKARSARALHHSGNSSLEAAVQWIVDHEDDPDIDRMPVIAVNINIESPPSPQSTEEVQARVQELRESALKRREEEGKRSEREREKERIRKGKEIAEAKRIAEDNERIQFIVARKAEKEEEKRARERIRQKLEADKAERRKLGLPKLIRDPVSPSGSVVQVEKPDWQTNQKQKFPIKRSTYAEQLRECLRFLKRNYMHDEGAVRKAFQTLLIYVSNVAKNPDEEKYRKIRINNPAFQNRVGRFHGGIEFLQLIGFETIERGKFLYLPRDKVHVEVLNSGLSVLRSALTNPFFGLFSVGQESV